MEPKYRPAAVLTLILFTVPASVQALAPSVVACMKAYNGAYEKPYSLSTEIWDDRCGDGLQARDILALGKEKCREAYEPKKSEPIGLSRKVWDKDCGAGLSGQSPAEYFQAKQKKFILESPIEKITAEQAYIFVHTKDVASPEVAAKREQLKARLAQAEAAWGKLDASLKKERDFLALPMAGTESQYRALMERFDHASAAPAGEEYAYVVSGAASGAGTAPDTRPLRPKSPSMSRVDRGIDDPEAVKERLRSEVKSIAARRDEKGRPVYEPKVIKIMEMVVESVPVRRGVPPLTDLVALEDAKQTIAVISKEQPPVVFDPKLKGLGLTTLRDGPDGWLMKSPNGEYKRMIKLRPGSRDGKEEYSLERLAGTFIHEVSHVQVALEGGGASNRVDENAAFFRQNRFYSNKREEFNQEIRSAQAGVGEFREKRVRDLIQSRDAFLGNVRARDLAAFEKDPEDFIYQIVPLYYGKDEEFKPGAVTLAQEKIRARKNKDQKRLRKLAQDEILDRQSKNQDAAWREAKRADCAAFAEQDAGAQALEKEMRALETRLEGKLHEKEADQIEKRLNQLREENEKILDTRESCRVS